MRERSRLASWLGPCASASGRDLTHANRRPINSDSDAMALVGGRIEQLVHGISRDDNPCAWWCRRNALDDVAVAGRRRTTRSRRRAARAPPCSCSSTNGSVTLVAEVSARRFERERLGGLERLQQRRGQPRVLLDQRAAHAEHVHDRKDAACGGSSPSPPRSGRRTASRPSGLRHDGGRGAMKPSMSPRSSRSRERAPAGAASTGSGGSASLIFSGRPGSSMPPRTQVMSAAPTPWSSCRIARAQTLAVSWYSGTPMRLPCRSSGAADADRGAP